MTIDNFVGSLVEMAKAYERLPSVEQELTSAHDQIEAYAKQVQRLEMKLMDRANEIEAMQAKVREAEAGRDQAETMFLELDEKAHKVLRALASIQTEAADMERELNPPKPEPVAEAKPEEPVYPNWSEHTTAIGADPNGNRVEAHPTAEPSSIQTDAGSLPVEASAATTIGGAGEGVSVPQGEHSAPSTDSQSQSAPSAVENTEPARAIDSNPDVSVSATPTSAPLDQTGTGTEPAASGSDEEPTKHEWVNGIKQIRQAWYEWYDRQPYEFKQHYDWNAA